MDREAETSKVESAGMIAAWRKKGMNGAREGVHSIRSTPFCSNQIISQHVCVNMHLSVFVTLNLNMPLKA